MRDDILCVVLCVVWVIELSPTHAVLRAFNRARERVTLLTVTALDPLKMTGRSPREATANNCAS